MNPSRKRFDDFTIVLPQLRDMGDCDLEVYSEITQLWQMVERYKMTTPSDPA